jgi:Zn finger protein HypA/HybF involved in hydrogenase expression
LTINPLPKTGREWGDIVCPECGAKNVVIVEGNIKGILEIDQDGEGIFPGK